MNAKDHFFTGFSPGLPAPVRHVPFAKEGQLQVVVAVIAAEYVQIGPVSHRQINEIVDCHAGAQLHGLVLSGWLEEVGRVQGRTSKLYGSTARASRELGLQGWSLLKEVA